MVKSIHRATDWVSAVTEDVVDREVAVWELGLLDSLPAGVGHAVMAAARFPGGSSLLMRNLTEEFLGSDEVPTRDWYTGVLRSLAALHGTYWQHPVLDRPGPALCGLEQLLGHLAPARLPALKRAVPGHFIIELIDEGWAGLAALVGAGMADELRALAENPAPALRVLAQYPRTLIHGDARPANVAFNGSRATLVDWARPAAGPPGIDVVYLLLMSPPSSPVPPDAAFAAYRTMLATSRGVTGSWSWWEEHVDVCVAVVFAMMAAIKVYHQGHDMSDDHPAHASITWWAERAGPGLRIIERW